MNEDKIQAIRTAREIIQTNPVYLDTETTGLGPDAEVIDLALIDRDGTELINILIKPVAPIPASATKIHGITNDDVRDAPTFFEICENLNLYSDRLIVIYNKDYDLRILAQSAKLIGVERWRALSSICAMELYAKFYGDWNDYYKSYRWQGQAKAAQQLGLEIPANLHRAAADANLCRLIVQAMAATPLPGEATQSSQLFIETFNSLAQHIHDAALAEYTLDEEHYSQDDFTKLNLITLKLSEAIGFGKIRDKNDSYIRNNLAEVAIAIMELSAAQSFNLGQAIVDKLNDVGIGTDTPTQGEKS